MVPLVSCLIGGILAGRYYPIPLPSLFAACLVVAATVWLRSRLSSALVCLLVFFVGWANCVRLDQPLHPGDLRQLLGPGPALASIRGTLLETPAPAVLDADENLWRTTARIEVREIRLHREAWRPAQGVVLSRTTGRLPREFAIGQTVELEGILRQPPEPVAPGLFDYRAHLRNERIYYLCSIDKPERWRLAEGSRASWAREISTQFLLWAKHALALGLPAEDDALRLQWSMILGWNIGLTNEMSAPFMRSGTMHIFAISGLHVVLIAAVLFAVLRLLQVPRNTAAYIVIPLLWFYTGVTGWQPSAIRSAIMGTVMIGTLLLKRPANLLNSLAASGLLILLWEPNQLFQASFQLSFFVVLSLALFAPPYYVVQEYLRLKDPFLPEKLRPTWIKRLDEALHYLFDNLATSVAAWLGSVPLIAWYFHMVTPVSILANLIVIPLSSMALACGLGSLFTAAWCPAAAALFNHSGWFFMRCMMSASDWFAQLPGAWLHVAPPNASGITLFYLSLLAVFTCFSAQSNLRGWPFWTGYKPPTPDLLEQLKPRFRWWPIVVLTVLALAWLGKWTIERPRPMLSVIPLRGGHSLYYEAQARGPDNFLIDCGRAESAEFVLKRYLTAQGINHLHGLVLTHGDRAQTSGAEVIRTNFNVTALFASPLRFRSADYRQLIARFGRNTNLFHEIFAGDRLGTFTVLHPELEDKFARADDGVIVLRAEIERCRVLMVSELGPRGQSALLNRHAPAEVRADVLIAGMPDQAEPLADLFIEAVQPRVIIVADSLYPATSRASKTLRERLTRREIPVVFTSDTGLVSLHFKPGAWELKGMNGVKLAGEIAPPKP